MLTLHTPLGQAVIGFEEVLHAMVVMCHLSHCAGAFILDFIVAKVNLHQPLIGVLLQGLADEPSTCSQITQAGHDILVCYVDFATQGRIRLCQISTGCQKAASHRWYAKQNT